MLARQARHLRRRSQSRSQNENGCGFSELFLATPADAEIILRTNDLRLKYWLLGYTVLSSSVLAMFRAQGWAWSPVKRLTMCNGCRMRSSLVAV